MKSTYQMMVDRLREIEKQLAPFQPLLIERAFLARGIREWERTNPHARLELQGQGSFLDELFRERDITEDGELPRSASAVIMAIARDVGKKGEVFTARDVLGEMARLKVRLKREWWTLQRVSAVLGTASKTPDRTKIKRVGRAEFECIQ